MDTQQHMTAPARRDHRTAAEKRADFERRVRVGAVNVSTTHFDWIVMFVRMVAAIILLGGAIGAVTIAAIFFGEDDAA